MVPLPWWRSSPPQGEYDDGKHDNTTKNGAAVFVAPLVGLCAGDGRPGPRRNQRLVRQVPDGDPMLSQKWRHQSGRPAARTDASAVYTVTTSRCRRPVSRPRSVRHRANPTVPNPLPAGTANSGRSPMTGVVMSQPGGAGPIAAEPRGVLHVLHPAARRLLRGHVEHRYRLRRMPRGNVVMPVAAFPA